MCKDQMPASGSDVGANVGWRNLLAVDTLRVWNGIIDGFGRGEIGPLLGARRKDMPGIFDDKRRGSGPISPRPNVPIIPFQTLMTDSGPIC